MPKFLKRILPTVVALNLFGIVVLGFLSHVQNRVITQQRELIQAMQTNKSCMIDPSVLRPQGEK